MGPDVSLGCRATCQNAKNLSCSHCVSATIAQEAVKALTTMDVQNLDLQLDSRTEALHLKIENHKRSTLKQTAGKERQREQYKLPEYLWILSATLGCFCAIQQSKQRPNQSFLSFYSTIPSLYTRATDRGLCWFHAA